MLPITSTAPRKRILVGIGELAVSNNPEAVMETQFLGSCLGVAVFDPLAGVAGLLHAMLPDAGLAPLKAEMQPGMFVDTGMESLLRRMSTLRANPASCVICAVGAAEPLGGQNMFHLGRRNLETLREMLGRNRLTLQAAETGGTASRSLFLSVKTGEVRLRSSGQHQDTILCKSLMTT